MWYLDSLLRPHLAAPFEHLDLGRVRHSGAYLLGALLPIAMMLLLAGMGVLAMRQHADQTATVQAAEMSRLVTQFRSGPVADAWRTLHEAWQQEGRRQTVLLSRLAGLSGDRYAAALHNYRDFVIETVEDRRLAQPVRVAFGFFKRLAVCVRVGHCPPDAARHAFGDAIWQFRNQHYYYFEAELSLAELDRVARMIAPDASLAQADGDLIIMP